MATAAPTKYDWLVVVPDFPGAQEQRLKVRPEHFAALPKTVESGMVKMGGAVFNEPPKGDDSSKWDFAGSTLVVVAETREEVIEFLKKDVYVSKGVWDIANVQIWPLKAAVWKAQ